MLSPVYRLLLALAVLAAVVVPGATSAAPPLEDPIPEPIQKAGPAVRLEPVATGLTAPNWGTVAPGRPHRLFVVDQTGQLWNIHLATGRKRLFLDVSSRLVPLGAFGPGTFDERGFLGVAFHPAYAANGLLYTYTSEPVNGPADFSTLPPGTPPDHQNVVIEWRVPNPADLDSLPTSPRVLLRIDQPQFNHNAGALNFGPDGLLYIATGDGGGADDVDGQPFPSPTSPPMVGHGLIGNGQNPTTILGKILRIEPDPSSETGTLSANEQYRIPPGNPFFGRPGYVTEIFAYGFRNPFRFSFDSATGALFAADVGQNDIEEVDVVLAGGNYGWNIKEGSFCFDPNGNDPGFVTDNPACGPLGLIEPIAEYDHDEGIAIVGGFVYRGAELEELRGHYVFGDYSRTFPPEPPAGRLFVLDTEDEVRAEHAEAGEIAELRLVGQDELGLFLLGFGQDTSGELYVLANATGVPSGHTGVVLRIAPKEH
jgi:glucose/arabinose dehydrogenase